MKIYRVYLEDELFKEYKKLCVDKDLSIPKQTAAIIRQFVNMQKENDKRFLKFKE
jgi:hypothetical protein